MIASKSKFLIGSDIEYWFLKKDKLTYVEDAVMDQSRARSEINLGTDHNGRVGEIRSHQGSPEYHSNQIQVDLKKLITGGILAKGIELTTGNNELLSIRENAQRYPSCGGHLHFSIKNSGLQELCKINLNYWLALTIQPLFSKEVFFQRLNQGYGKLGSIRMKSYGFEYRSIPSFIFDKEVTEGVIALAYSIVLLTVEGKLRIRKEAHDLNWINEVSQNFYNFDSWKLRNVREENIKNILKKRRLGKLLKYISPLFEAIKEQRIYSGDIAEGWGLDYKYYVLNSRDKIKNKINDLRQVAERLRVQQRESVTTIEENNHLREQWRQVSTQIEQLQRESDQIDSESDISF